MRELGVLGRLYGHSLALLTDLYELTMACAYWRTGMADRPAVFHLSFRECPFQGEFAVAAGAALVAELLAQWRFTDDDLAYLKGLQSAEGRPLFDPGFLQFLAGLDLRCDVDVVPEGTVMFAHEPLLRVQGPLLQCQLLETPLLTLMNFQTLIATKAARICLAAEGAPVLEFGLRRAQGVDGGLAASRAAYLGGCAATSNVLAGRLFGIPVRGTHAHSWVLAFDSEQEAFAAYAQAMPHNCIFLVDTYDTLQGVRRAIEAARRLPALGGRLIGVRLDSGDLARLSRQVRRMLDDAGLRDAKIVASNDLDEHQIQRLRRAGATIDIWGVGTRLATAYDQPALGGVYKLTAIQDAAGRWRRKIKLSETPAKTSDPGILQVRRLKRDGRFWGDAVYDELLGWAAPPQLVDRDTGRPRDTPSDLQSEPLLVPLFRNGRLTGPPAPLEQARRRCREQLDQLDSRHLRLEAPARYPVLLERRLHDEKQRLIAELRRRSPAH